MDTFEKEFETLRELGQSTFVLRGATMIVEIQSKEEVKTKSGLIVSTPGDHTRRSTEENRLDIGKVLMVGPGYWDEDTKSYIKLDIEVGAILILPQYLVQPISIFPGIARPTNNKLALVKDDAILAYYPTAEAFEQAKTKLN